MINNPDKTSENAPLIALPKYMEIKKPLDLTLRAIKMFV